MKRILYVLDNFPKISETFVLNEITELIHRGYNVEILALRDPRDNIINEDVIKYELRRNTRYFCLPPPLKLKYGYSFSPVFYNSVVNTFKQNYGKSTLTDLVRLSYYAPYYKHIDLIHSHFGFRAAVTGLQISQILDKPFTFTAHAFEIFREPYCSDKRLKMLTDGASKVITPSIFNKNYIIQKTECFEDKIEIIRATINPLKFINQNRLNHDKTKIKIVAIGRLTEKKGFEYLIKSMAEITESHPETFLNIIGTGEIESDLIKLADELNLSKSINFLGAQTNEKCMHEILSSDISVLPCVKAIDGDVDVCPLSLQEAMAMEVPVISTTVGSVPELIENGIEGILVPERDESALTQAIEKLIASPELREKMGKKGRDKILKEFNIEKQVSLLIKHWNI